MNIKIKIEKSNDNEIYNREHVKIINADTGEMIKYVKSIDYHADIDSRPTITLTFIPERIEFEGEENLEVKIN